MRGAVQFRTVQQDRAADKRALSEWGYARRWLCGGLKAASNFIRVVFASLLLPESPASHLGSAAICSFIASKKKHLHFYNLSPSMFLQPVR